MFTFIIIDTQVYIIIYFIVHNYYVKDVKKLEQLYATVEDVDLIVGVLLEPIVGDGMVGETARCIIADAFYRIRYSDRLFCDVQCQPGSFTCGIQLIVYTQYLFCSYNYFIIYQINMMFCGNSIFQRYFAVCQELISYQWIFLNLLGKF